MMTGGRGRVELGRCDPGATCESPALPSRQSSTRPLVGICGWRGGNDDGSLSSCIGARVDRDLGQEAHVDRERSTGFWRETARCCRETACEGLGGYPAAIYPRFIRPIVYVDGRLQDRGWPDTYRSWDSNRCAGAHGGATDASHWSTGRRLRVGLATTPAGSPKAQFGTRSKPQELSRKKNEGLVRASHLRDHGSSRITEWVILNESRKVASSGKLKGRIAVFGGVRREGLVIGLQP